MKTIIILVLLLGAAGGGFYLWQQKQPTVAAATPETTTARIARGNILLTVAATGRVVANLDVDIKCKASGQIINLPFDVSDAVKKGDLLAQLDPVDEQRGVNLAETRLASSTARVATAKQNLLIAEQKLATDTSRAKASLLSSEARAERAKIRADRLKSALAGNAASQEDYDSARTEAVQAAAELTTAKVHIEELKTQELALELQRQNIKLAEAEARSDQISLDNAKQRLIETKMMAPIDGVVVARNVQVGQMIASAMSNVGGGTTVMTLSDLSHIFVLASVDESDIGKVEVDQEVRITADAYPGREFKGKVVRIGTRGANVQNVVTFEVKIEVVQQGRRAVMLKPEMTTNVEIIAANKQDVLVAPAEAITRKQGQRYASVVLGADKTEERIVQTGITDGTNVEIVSGLAEGDTVKVRKQEAESRWRPGGQRGMNPMMGLPGGSRGGRR